MLRSSAFSLKDRFSGWAGTSGCFALLTFLLWLKKKPLWIALGGVSIGYLIWANVVRWIIVPSSSLFVLTSATHLIADPLGIAESVIRTGSATALGYMASNWAVRLAALADRKRHPCGETLAPPAPAAYEGSP